MINLQNIDNLPWWMEIGIKDDEVVLKNIDEKVIIFDDCGDVFVELFKYAIDIDKKSFATILTKKNGVLNMNIRLPQKSEDENFNDLKHTVKAYRNILKALLSTGCFKDLSTIESQKFFNLVQQDINNRADTLEYFLLNNSNAIRNKRNYYDGRIELDMYKLLQEMYILAAKGNEKCEWMLKFNTPLQIWFVTMVQSICISLEKQPSLTRSDKKYYKQVLDKTEITKKSRINSLTNLKNVTSMHISQGIKYTLMQIMDTPPIGTCYDNYLKSIRKQAYAIDRTPVYKRI